MVLYLIKGKKYYKPYFGDCESEIVRLLVVADNDFCAKTFAFNSNLIDKIEGMTPLFEGEFPEGFIYSIP